MTDSNKNLPRCPWVEDDPLSRAYHDEEWGVPVRDDHTLFEFLVLEGAQAGLSWQTILQKRDAYREAFDDFDPETVARYGEERIQELLTNPGIVRNEMKIRSAVTNAAVVLDLQAEFGSFATYLWQFVDGAPIQNDWASLEEIPAKTERSQSLAADLKKRGASFVGPTICYAFMQAVGMVNDHVSDCFRNAEIKAAARKEG